MSTTCCIGAIHPDNPTLVHARIVHYDGYPSNILPTLAAIWATHAHHDTAALITTILANDWEHLDEDTTAATSSHFAGQQPVPGVGVTLASTSDGVTVDPPEPVTVFPLCHAAHLDVEWIYLIDAVTDTIIVHTGDGTPTAVYPLVSCLSTDDATAGRISGSEPPPPASALR
ncbi:hypothetical protein [Micromonospora sp. WMMD980]|uniref:hypothetical protein n=1 Tax=Micromonospora sp. WMMD980 TaxID=3016088 RepID=UPI0024170FBB|nr:hypothetical protein [Micromonospora sp. WMMD980]MDG4803651.1 hypothetical protein [Micromonospora sp. WMMD980]